MIGKSRKPLSAVLALTLLLQLLTPVGALAQRAKPPVAPAPMIQAQERQPSDSSLAAPALEAGQHEAGLALNAEDSTKVRQKLPIDFVLADDLVAGEVAAWPQELIVCREPKTTNVMGTAGLTAAALPTFDLVVVPAKSNMQAAMDELKADPTVLFVEPNYLVRAAAADTPNDPHFSEQWALPFIGTPAAWAEHEVALRNATAPTIAVLDSGVDTTHEDLSSDRLLAGKNFASKKQDGTPYADPTDYSDDYGHGTQVTGIMAAIHDNGLGISGVLGPTPINILPVKVLNNKGEGTVFDLANGIRFAADQGAKVINLSLTTDGNSHTLAAAIGYAQEKGALVVAAMGGTWSEPYPASYPGVIAVGAVDSNTYTTSTTDGEHLDLMAPGYEILSTGLDDAYTEITGTSAAAAHVSAAAALYLALNPVATPGAVTDALIATAEDLPDYDGGTGWDRYTGYGLLQVRDLLNYSPALPPQLKFTAPPPGSRVMGVVTLQVEVVNSGQISGVAFYLDELSDSKLLAKVDKTTQHYFGYAWNTLTVTDGQYNVFARCYQEDDGVITPLGEAVALSVQVENDVSTGLTLQIIAPNGTVPSKATLTLYRHVSPEEDDYDPQAPYVEVDVYAVDALGLVRIPGVAAPSLHNYVVVIQGTFDDQGTWQDFISVRELEGPGSLILDTTTARPVEFSLLDMEGKQLPYSRFVLRVLDGKGLRIDSFSVALQAGPTRTIYLDERSYDAYAFYSKSQANDASDTTDFTESQAYFLHIPQLDTGATTTVEFDPRGTTAQLTGRLFKTVETEAIEDTYSSFRLSLSGEDIRDVLYDYNWNISFYEREIIASFGEYTLGAAVYDSLDYEYYFQRSAFVIKTAEAIVCDFGGLLTLEGEVSEQRISASSPTSLPLLKANFRLTDKFGNTLGLMKRPVSKYQMENVPLAMKTYEGSGEYGSPHVVNSSWQNYSVNCEVNRPQGDYWLELGIYSPLFGGRTSDWLPFSIVAAGQPPEEETVAVPVYDLANALAKSLPGSVYLYALRDEDGDPYWGRVGYYSVDADGYIHIPKDVQLSDTGNAIVFSGEVNDKAVFYNKTFTTLEELGTIRLHDCTVSLSLSTRDAAGNLSDVTPDTLLYLQASEDADPVFIERVYGEEALRVVPGHYAFVARDDGYDSGEAYFFTRPREHITSSQTIQLGGGENTTLTVGTTAGFFMVDTYYELIEIYSPLVDDGFTWYPQRAAPLTLTPGNYYAQGWVAQLDPESDSNYNKKKWIYGVDLADEDLGLELEVGNTQITLGGPFQVDFNLMETDLTTDEHLQGEVLISDAQGNRVFAVAVETHRGGGGEAYAFSDYVETDDVGRLLVPMPEVLAQLGSWPFIYPFLRLYQIDPDTGQETRILNEFAEELFYNFSLPLADLPPSEYRVEVAIAIGPEGVITKSKNFSLTSASVRLDALAAFTNAQTLNLEGSATPGARVDLFYWYEHATPVLAGTAIADGLGRFSLPFKFPTGAQDGLYSFSGHTVVDEVPGKESQPVSIRLDRSAPAAATNLQATAEDANNVLITWEASASSDVKTYRLYRNDVQVAEILASPNLSYLDSGLTAATTYTYTLVAIDEAGNISGPVSAQVATGTTVDTKAPVRPQAPQVTYELGGTATITWQPTTDNIGVTSYQLLRFIGAAESETEATVLGSVLATDALTYTDSGLWASSTYGYAVKAYDAAGNASVLSPVTRITTTALALRLADFRLPVDMGRLDLGLIDADAELGLRILGERQREAEVEITYTTYLGENGQELDVAQTNTTIVPLAEEVAVSGSYRGTFILPKGLASIDAMQGLLTDGNTSVTRAIAPLPLQVTGALQVEIPEQLLAGAKGLKLSVWSETRGGGQPLTIMEDTSAYTVSNLAPASDYMLRVTSQLGRVVALMEKVQVKGGLTRTLEITPLQPAQITVSVRDSDGNSVKGATVSARHTGRLIPAVSTSCNAAGLAMLAMDTLEGDELYIHVEPPLVFSMGGWYEASNYAVHTATAGANTVEITLSALPTGTVSGEATLEDKPLGGVDIRLVARVGNRSFAVNTMTDSNGSYQAVVPAGQVSMSASTAGNYECTNIDQLSGGFPVGGGAIVDKDFLFVRSSKIKLDVSITAKYLDQTLITYDGMDWSTATHFHLAVKRDNGANSGNYPLTLLVDPYEEITVSVDGVEAGLPKATAKVQLDEDRSGKVDIVLEEKARIVGQLVDGDGYDLGPMARWQVSALKQENGKLVRVATVKPDRAAAFTLSLPGPGQYIVKAEALYDLLYSSTSPRAEIGPVTVGLEEIVDVGKVTLSYHYANALGYLAVGQKDVAPGTIISAQAVFSRRQASPYGMDDAKVTLELPPGCELIPDSVAFAGNVLTSDSSNLLRFNLGDLQPQGSEELRVSFMAKLSANFSYAGKLFLGASLQWRERDIVTITDLVPVELRPTIVSIEGQKVVAQPHLVVNGRAPANSPVSVYDQTDLLGMIQASPSGQWQLSITLPDWGSQAKHYLRAVATLDGEVLQSDLLTVKYDPNAPSLTQVVFQQGVDGRVITFYPDHGVARFPYVIRPGAGPLTVALTFDNPNRVNDVKVSVPPYTVTAVPQSDDSFVASIHFPGGNLGAIYVEHETKQSPDDLNNAQPISEEQLRRQLPVAVRDFEAELEEEILPPPPDVETPGEPWPQDAKTRAINVALPQLPGVEARIETTIARDVTYAPTAAEKALADKTGIPVYGLKSSAVTVTEDEISFWVQVYISEDYLEGATQGLDTLGKVKAAAAGKLVRQLTKVKLKPIAEKSIDMREKYKDAKDLWTAPDQFDRLNAILDASNECGASASKYRKMVDDAARDLMIANGSKWAFKLGAVLIAPVSFGLGSVALFAAGEALDLALDYGMEKRMDDIVEQMAADSECRDEEEDDDDDDYDYDEDDDRDRPKRKKAAKPTWIWDPSGIVYSGVMTNPLEGVRTTLYEVHSGGALTFWDADWYGQQNPLYTDGVGYYGWDVPVGKWQVVYEKEGYMPAMSEVLPVPPPQLEVHMNLVNLTPPQAIWAQAAAGGSYLQVIFDQYMLANTLSPSTLALTVMGDEELEYVAGRVEAIDAVASPADPDQLLTRKVRFVPTDSLTANEKYTLTFSGAAQSYGAIPMGSTLPRVITVPKTPTAVTGVSALKVTPDYTWADVTWEDPALDYLQVKLVWKLDGTLVGQAVVDKGVGKYQLSNLFADTTYKLDVITVDGLGNESAAQTLSVKTKAPKTYDPKPPVDPPIKPPVVVDPPAVQPLGEVSVLRVNASDGSLQVSWKEPTSADLKEVRLTWKANGTEALLGQQLLAKGIGNYTITGLTNGTEYEVIVRTISKQGKESTGVKTVGTPSASDSVTVTTTGEQQTISAFDQGLQLSLAAGSFEAGTTLKLSRISPEGLALSDKTLAFMSHAYSCDVETEPLQGPMYIALRYDQELLGKEDARKLGIYRQDEQDPTKWVYVGGVVDLVTGRLTVRIDRLGTYAVMLCKSTFSDITKHWAKGDIEIITARSLAVGIGNGLYDPNRPITRAELATFMVRLVLNGDRFDASQTAGKTVPQFSDVKPGEWYSGVVKTAAKLGIVPATGGAFRPQAPATRLEMAGMLAEVMALLDRPLEGEGVSELPFTDVKSLSSKDRAIIGQNWFNGLMGGMGDGKFSPQGTSTRAQVAAVMLRVLERTGQAITTSIEEGTLKASSGTETQYVLNDCRGDSSSYRLTPMSDRAAQELASLNGQTVRAVVLRVQEAKPGTAIPQLRVLSVTAIAGG